MDGHIGNINILMILPLLLNLLMQKDFGIQKENYKQLKLELYQDHMPKKFVEFLLICHGIEKKKPLKSKSKWTMLNVPMEAHKFIWVNTSGTKMVLKPLLLDAINAN